MRYLYFNMKAYFFTVLGFFVFTNIVAQSITPIDEDEFNDSSFKSLKFLNKELENVRMVGLGEALHNMGATYSAKVKMVKFLHQKCGFDVIAFESPLYNLSKINTQIREHTATVDTLAQNISGIWNTNELEELFEYIIQTSHTDNPLEYTGFDESFFDSKKNQDIVKDYKKFIQNLNSKIESKIVVDSIFYSAINGVVKNAYYYTKTSPKDTLSMNKVFKKVNQSLNEINYSNDSYFYFWKLMTDNLQSVYRKNYDKGTRELRMAENLNFLAKKKYPDKKIIVWAATYHLLKDLKTIDSYKKEDTKKKMMGAFIDEMYGDKYYVMAFTPFQGKVGYKGYLGLLKTKVRSKKGSLEHYINKNYNVNYAYISLRNKEAREEIYMNDLRLSNLIWRKGLRYNGELMDIPETVDAIFYLKNERTVDLEDE